MQDTERPTILIVRGAGPAGRRIAATVTEAGGVPVILDERTGANENVHSVRVSFEDVAQPRRAVHDITLRHGGLAAVVLLPAPTSAVRATSGGPWETALGHELALVAGLVRTAAPALAASSGAVISVSAPPDGEDPTSLASLRSQVCEPAVGALAEVFGFEVVPLSTDATGAARGSAVADAVTQRVHAAAALPGAERVAASRAAG